MATSQSGLSPALVAGLTPVMVSPGALAERFYLLSQALDDYRLDHWNELSAGARGQLKDEAQGLDTRAHYLTAAGIDELTQSVQPNLDAIQAATSDAQSALAQLIKVEFAILIATASVTLGAAIATGNAALIGSAAIALTNTVSAAVQAIA